MVNNFQKKIMKLLFASILVFSLGIAGSPWTALANEGSGAADTPSEKPKLVVPVISDTQLGRAEGDPERFNNAMKQLNQLAPKQDAIVFIGDLTSHGYESEIRRLKAMTLL